MDRTGRLDEKLKKVIILGLGNPILGDDGVGWRVAAGVRAALDGLPQAASWAAGEVDIDCLAAGGLALMERLIDYDRAILIDALNTGATPGRVYSLELEDLPNLAAGHLNSAHDTTLINALQVGRSMGAALPDPVWVVGIEAHNLFQFSEELTPPVAAAVPLAVNMVLELLVKMEI
jgi:hydrogenase maturation protease